MSRFRTLRWRLTALYAAVAAVMLIVVLAIGGAVVETALLQSTAERLEIEAGLVVADATGGRRGPRATDLAAGDLATVLGGQGTAVVILDGAGGTLAAEPNGATTPIVTARLDTADYAAALDSGRVRDRGPNPAQRRACPGGCRARRAANRRPRRWQRQRRTATATAEGWATATGEGSAIRTPAPEAPTSLKGRRMPSPNSRFRWRPSMPRWPSSDWSPASSPVSSSFSPPLLRGRSHGAASGHSTGSRRPRTGSPQATSRHGPRCGPATTRWDAWRRRSMGWRNRWMRRSRHTASSPPTHRTSFARRSRCWVATSTCWLEPISTPRHGLGRWRRCVGRSIG